MYRLRTHTYPVKKKMPATLKDQSLVTSEKIRLKKMPLGMRYILTPHFNVGLERHPLKKNAVGMEHKGGAHICHSGSLKIYASSKSISNCEIFNSVTTLFYRFNSSVRNRTGQTKRSHPKFLPLRSHPKSLFHWKSAGETRREFLFF